MKLFVRLSVFLMSAPFSLAIANGGGSSVGTPSPDSMGCLKAGGRVLLLQSESGDQNAICAVGVENYEQGKSEELVSGFSLLRLSNGVKEKSIEAFFTRTSPPNGISVNIGERIQDAHAYCQDLGGTVEKFIRASRPDEVISICGFPDKSFIGLWTLYKGPAYAPELIKTLKQLSKKRR